MVCESEPTLKDPQTRKSPSELMAAEIVSPAAMRTARKFSSVRDCSGCGTAVSSSTSRNSPSFSGLGTSTVIRPSAASSLTPHDQTYVIAQSRTRCDIEERKLTVPSSSKNSECRPPAATASKLAPGPPNTSSSMFFSTHLFRVGLSYSPRKSTPIPNWPKLPVPHTNSSGAGRGCSGGVGRALK